MGYERYGYVLLMSEKWWRRLVEENSKGRKVHIFVRRGLRGPLKTRVLLFYVKHPIREIRGAAEFVERFAGDKHELWKKYGEGTCLKNYNEFLRFLGKRGKATFIKFRGFRELPSPVPAQQLLTKAGIARMPRGGKYLSEETVNQLIGELKFEL